MPPARNHHALSPRSLGEVPDPSPSQPSSRQRGYSPSVPAPRGVRVQWVQSSTKLLVIVYRSILCRHGQRGELLSERPNAAPEQKALASNASQTSVRLGHCRRGGRVLSSRNRPGGAKRVDAAAAWCMIFLCIVSSESQAARAEQAVGPGGTAGSRPKRHSGDRVV